MAGSYGHVDLIDGKFSMIENMGDAHECIEQLLWLTAFFARIASGVTTIQETHRVIEATLGQIYYPMLRGDIPADDLKRRVDEIMDPDK